MNWAIADFWWGLYVDFNVIDEPLCNIFVTPDASDMKSTLSISIPGVRNNSVMQVEEFCGAEISLVDRVEEERDSFLNPFG